jgi:hypothetical protein
MSNARLVREGVRCDEQKLNLDLPSYARITLNALDKPIDPLLRIAQVLRIELPHGIRIDCTWDWNAAGYWISAWTFQNGAIQELVLRWSPDKQSLVRAVELLSRQFD